LARQGLNPKQRLFAREYLVDLNATQAAIRAGYSAEWANRTASRLVGKSRLRRYIRELQEERAARVELTADKVVRELALIGFSNVADYQVTDAGNLTIRPHADVGAVRAVSSFKRKVRKVPGTEGVLDIETEVKLWDKVGALKLLAAHLGIVTPADRPDLEKLLGHFPAPVADAVRQLLAAALLHGGSAGGGPAAEA
jgi:phage terminase small subunit